MYAARWVSSAVLPCSVTRTGRPSSRARSAPRRRASRGWTPENRLPLGGAARVGDGAGAVVAAPLVVLDADEVVLSRELQPARVDLGPLAVAHRRVVADDDVVDERDATVRPADRAGAP